MSPNLGNFGNLLTCGSSPFPLAKFRLRANPVPWFSYPPFHCIFVHKKSLFENFCWRCCKWFAGWPFPSIKNPDYADTSSMFFVTLITFYWKTIIPNHILIALKIAKILAAQASAESFKSSCGASAITSKIVALQVPTSVEQAFWSKKFLLGYLSKVCTNLRSDGQLQQIWAVYDLMLPRYNNTDFAQEILPGMPTTNKISKSYCMFIICNSE